MVIHRVARLWPGASSTQEWTIWEIALPALVKPSDAAALDTILAAASWAILSQSHPARMLLSFWPTDTVMSAEAGFNSS